MKTGWRIITHTHIPLKTYEHTHIHTHTLLTSVSAILYCYQVLETLHTYCNQITLNYPWDIPPQQPCSEEWCFCFHLNTEVAEGCWRHCPACPCFAFQLVYNLSWTLFILILSLGAFSQQSGAIILASTGCLIMKKVKYEPLTYTKMHHYNLRQVSKDHWEWDNLINMIK